MASPADVFKALDLDGNYSLEAVAKIDGELKKLMPRILKTREAVQAALVKQREVATIVNDLVAARGVLHGNRPSRPGDVVV